MKPHFILGLCPQFTNKLLNNDPNITDVDIVAWVNTLKLTYHFFPQIFFSEGANIRMWSADISPKSRRGILRRAVFSEEQRKELERTFRRQKYISKTDRNKLAADLSLKESQVIEYELPHFCLINLWSEKNPLPHQLQPLMKKPKSCSATSWNSDEYWLNIIFTTFTLV